jgi:hypothetical protein
MRELAKDPAVKKLILEKIKKLDLGKRIETLA